MTKMVDFDDLGDIFESIVYPCQLRHYYGHNYVHYESGEVNVDRLYLSLVVQKKSDRPLR